MEVAIVFLLSELDSGGFLLYVIERTFDILMEKRLAGKSKPGERDTKNKILKAAEILFAEKGFDSTGIDAIAKSVGIAKSVIYYHFKNKEAILSALIDDFLEKSLAKKRVIGEKFFASGGTNIAETIKSSIALFDENSRIVKLIVMESIKEDGSVPLFDLWKQNADFISENWSDRLKAGAIEYPKKFILSSFFMFLMPWVGYYVFTDKLIRNYDLSRDEISESFTEAILEYYETITLPRLWDLKKLGKDVDEK